MYRPCCNELIRRFSGPATAKLPPEEAADLRRRYHAGDLEARDRLLLSVTHMAVGLAKVFARRVNGDVEDLTQSALCWLMDRMHIWDPQRGAAFGTWAQKVMHNHLCHVAENYHNTIHVPVTRRQDSQQYREAAYRARYGKRSLERSSYGDDQPALRERLVDRGLQPPEEAVQNEECERVRKVLAALSHRHRVVLTKHYVEDYTLEECSPFVNGVSRERVRQLSQSAVLKFKAIWEGRVSLDEVNNVLADKDKIEQLNLMHLMDQVTLEEIHTAQREVEHWFTEKRSQYEQRRLALQLLAEAVRRRGDKEPRSRPAERLPRVAEERRHKLQDFLDRHRRFHRRELAQHLGLSESSTSGILRHHGCCRALGLGIWEYCDDPQKEKELDDDCLRANDRDEAARSLAVG